MVYICGTALNPSLSKHPPQMLLNFNSKLDHGIMGGGTQWAKMVILQTFVDILYISIEFNVTGAVGSSF